MFDPIRTVQNLQACNDILFVVSSLQDFRSKFRGDDTSKLCRKIIELIENEKLAYLLTSENKRK